mmetsp:Transcript_17806/g.32246  ORF Transcript_17806/g.32246 Transcript_17806/m.32246 type:complete len:680 (-) Transcript_17806:105-2144(-)
MAAAFAPWRRSVNSGEEYYPCSGVQEQAWNRQGQASAVMPNTWRPDHNVYMINLDGYSDDDSDEEQPPAVLAMLAGKKAAQAGAATSEGEPASNSSPPWKRPTSRPSSTSGPEEQPKHEQAKASGLQLPPWRRGHADSKGDLSCSTMDSSASNLSSSATDSSSAGSDTEQEASPSGEKAEMPSDLDQDAQQEDCPHAKVAEASCDDGQRKLQEQVLEKPETQPTQQKQIAQEVEVPTRISWMSQRRNGSAEHAFERRIKSLLNKLTLEKFDQICMQIMQSGFETLLHVELFIQEVFEKAIGQHHFIEMYADLCVEMQRHLATNPLAEDPKGVQFKKLLLNQCQRAFEANLNPPANLEQLEGEDRLEAEVRYKMSMLGNIRLVGALLTRKMLAGKVLIAIAEELLSDTSSEALESLATLLTAVGRTFDTPEWPYHIALRAVFDKVRTLANSSTVERRVQCLLKDVLDLRGDGWQDHKPKRLEGPRKLSNVAESSTPIGSSPSRDGKRTPLVGTSRLASFFGAPSKKVETAVKKEAAKKVEAKPFDLAAFRIEVKQTLEELAVSHDVKDACERLASTKCPAQHQAVAIGLLLEEAVQGRTTENRERVLALVVGLIMGEHWTSQALSSSLTAFLTDVAPDLYIDMPNLPQILSKEVYACMAPLVAKNLLLASEHDAIIHTIC